MDKRLLLNIALFALVSVPSALSAEEGVESFTLPEAPPAIERKKMPPLDKPVVQKQDYMPDSEIEPPFVVQSKDFFSFGEEERPRDEAQVSKGSWGAYSGRFGFASPYGWDLSYEGRRTDGEQPNLAGESDSLSFSWDGPAGSDFFGSAAAGLLGSKVWTQRKSDYRASSALSWYPLETLNVKASASGASGEVSGMEKNDAFTGTAGVRVMPWQGHSLSAVYRKFSDSSDPASKDFIDADVVYGFAPSESLLLKAGARMQKDESFPQGGVYWNFAGGARFSAEYRPGTEKPEWDSLYINGYFVKTAPVVWPRAENFGRCAVSYYFREEFSVKLGYSQGKWRDYLCLSRAAGTDYLSPADAGEKEVSAGTAEASFSKGALSGGLSFAENSAPGVPMVPENSFSARLECALPAGWSVSAGYDHASERLSSLGSAARTEPYDDLSAGFAKEFDGMRVYALCGNITGNKLEAQPGFISRSPYAEAGLAVKFR